MPYSYSGITRSLQALSRSLQGVNFAIINFKIFIRNSSGSVVYDNWGNPVLSSNPTTNNLTLECVMRQDKDPLVEGNPGVNRNRIYLLGTLRTPASFQLPIPRASQSEYLQDGVWRKGTFYPIEQLNQPLSEAITSGIAFGKAIAGYFEILEND